MKPDPKASALIADADFQLIARELPKITGWLGDDAAFVTAYLMNSQLSLGLHGPALEFGVYHGKYLALLLHLELKRDGWVGGYDIFEHCHQETAWRHADLIFGSRDRMGLWKANTRNVTPEDVLAHIGHSPRFVSVDGDHTAEGALHDLHLASAVLLDRGIIAIDDVFNVNAIGVSEGTYRFFLEPGCAFAPFLYIANKMFVCRRADHAMYLRTAIKLTDDYPDLSLSRRYRATKERDPSAVIQRLFGSDILIIDEG